MALTEAELIARLRVRYTEKAGNGDAWAFIPKVRSAAGFDARRTIDAYAMSLWPSRGLSLTAFEIKSARSDWLREMKNPAKAEEFCELADFFYLVVGDKNVVGPGELPETWGLIVPRGAGLKVEVQAPPLRELAGARGTRPLPPGMSRSFIAALLRAACAVGGATPAEIVEAREQGRAEVVRDREFSQKAYHPLYDELAAAVAAFERESGVRIHEYGQTPAEVGAAVRAVLRGEADLQALNGRFEGIRAQAQRLADQAAAFIVEDPEP